MTIEEALFGFLSGRPEITAVIGSSPTRFYPVAAPQNPLAPFAVYQQINEDRERAGSGPTRAGDVQSHLLARELPGGQGACESAPPRARRGHRVVG